VGYSKTFNSEKYKSIAKVLDSIQSLAPGGRVIVSEAPGLGIGIVRYLVYDFLFHTRLKAQFRLKTLGTELLIQRLGSGEALKVEVQVGRGEMIEALIELWGTAEARAALEEWIKASKISPEEGNELWESVQKIME